MSDDRIDRYRDRKARRSRSQVERVPPPAESTLEVGPVDQAFLSRLANGQEQHYSVSVDYAVAPQEVESLLEELRGKVGADHLEVMFASMHEQTLQAVIGPFGLARVLFQDKVGGNVSTVHNAEKGIFANPEDCERWERWKNTTFNREPYDQGFDQHRKKTFENNPSVRDGYRGIVLSDNRRTHRDHVVSAKEIHENPNLGLHFSLDDKVKLAISESNTVYTDGSLNQSKGAMPVQEWIGKTHDNGISKADHYQVNKLEAIGRDLYARSVINGEIALEVSTKVAHTGAIEGVNMGLQQALGLLLYELASGLVDEARDCLRQWRGGDSVSNLLVNMKDRYERLQKRLVERWDDACKAFVAGSISGFVSNLVTFVINTFFATTFKRVVRIIREGTFSLLRAFKMLIFPPEGMSGYEAAHEASKVVAAGLALAVGLGIEEFVSKSLLALAPFLAPLVDTVAAVVVGILTGVGAALLVYMLDKIDFFGVNRKREHDALMEELSAMAQSAQAESEAIMRSFDDPSIQPA